MPREKRNVGRVCRLQIALAVIGLSSAGLAPAQGQPTAHDPHSTALKQAFEAAWSRQPEAAAAQAHRDAAAAQQLAARAWTPEPPAVEASAKTDRLNRNQGSQELEFGIALPLWLPGERSRSGALAEAESSAVENRILAARLRVAGVLRQAYWQWQRARIDAEVARDQLANARQLATDVAKRLRAGDLARADHHQAEAAVAVAESAMAATTAAAAAAELQLQAIVGDAVAAPALARAAATPEPEPRVDAVDSASADMHPDIKDLSGRATVAERAAALAAVRSRPNPELTLTTARERAGHGDPYNQTITFGFRLPFGGGSRHLAATASAQAEAAELQALAALERDRVVADRAAGRLRVESARLQLEAAERRAQLAQESRGFFEKSFRLGDTDLPTRLRIEAEAIDAQRQAARGRVELFAATSLWRQALGLLPE